MGCSLILYNQPSCEAENDEQDVLDQVSYVEAGLTSLGYSVAKRALGDDLKNELLSVSKGQYDFVFNLTEAVYGSPELIYFVPAMLNLLKIPYSGAPVEAAFSTANKVYAKKMMAQAGIAVAKTYKVSEADTLSLGGTYIVKPIWEDGSVGITEESVFTYDGEVPSAILGKDDNHWFIEDYLDGREFNVSLIAEGDGSPLVLPPAEMQFKHYPEGVPTIVSYKAKWDEDSFQYKSSVRTFDVDISATLAKKIHEVAVKCWSLFQLKGYARVDLRSNSRGDLFVMEVNANPCISADGGFVAACRHNNITDNEVIRRIVSDLNRFE